MYFSSVEEGLFHIFARAFSLKRAKLALFAPKRVGSSPKAYAELFQATVDHIQPQNKEKRVIIVIGLNPHSSWACVSLQDSTRMNVGLEHPEAQYVHSEAKVDHQLVKHKSIV